MTMWYSVIVLKSPMDRNPGNRGGGSRFLPILPSERYNRPKWRTARSSAETDDPSQQVLYKPFI